MTDETLKELWDAKDAIARKHKWNLQALVKDLRSASKEAISKDRGLHRAAAEQSAAADVPTAPRSPRS